MRQTPWKEASLSQEKKVAVLKESNCRASRIRFRGILCYSYDEEPL